MNNYKKRTLTKLHRLYCLLTLLFICACTDVPEYCSDHNLLDPFTQFCYQGKTVNKCGGEQYNPSSQFCYQNRTIVSKCGGEEYDPSAQGCYGGTVRSDANVLTVNIEPTGGGTVARNPSQTNYKWGTTVTVTAAAASGYKFTGWSGASTDTSNSVTIIMTGNLTLTANFQKPTVTPPIDTAKYAVVVSSAGTGATGSGNYAAGATVSINAGSAPSGQVFKNWTVTSGGVTLANANSAATTFVMPSNAVTVTANWQATSSGGGGSYKTVTIGGKTWMAENLNIVTENSWCYLNRSDSCAKYGRLYTWEAAKTVCPSGWHLPSSSEWDDLVTAAGGYSTAGKKLKSTSGWNSYNGASGNGTDDFGFSALPGGIYDGSSFGYAGLDGYWWTAAEYSSGGAYRWRMGYDGGYVYEGNDGKSHGFSVRCVKDESMTPTYSVIVSSTGTSASGSGNYAAGATVSISAGTPPSGQVFKNWTTTSAGVTFANAYNATTTFTMPANNVTVTAVFEAAKYTVTVTGGTGGGSYAAGATVSINAGSAPTGQVFDKWTASGVTIANPNSTSTSFTMPANNVTVTANWKQASTSWVDGGTLSYGGQSYRTVIIGGKRWMAENLNYQPQSGNSWCYGGNNTNCATYGRLYDWATAMGIGTTYNSSTYGNSADKHQGVCPSGWHLPSRDEWGALAKAAGGTGDYGTGGTAGTALKSTTGWYNTGGGTGTDTYGFSALPGGEYYGSSFIGVGNDGSWWTATEVPSSHAYGRSMYYYSDYVYEDGNAKSSGFSVRCVEGAASLYAVTVSGGSGATGTGSYTAGTTVSINAGTPPSGQVFKNWTVTSGGVTLGNANSAATSFTMPANNVTVTAVFEAAKYTVTVTGGTGGGSYAAGVQVNINAGTAPAGQEFKNWTVTSGGVTLANANSAATSFTMPSNAVTVTAVFEAITYTLTTNVSPSGGGTVSRSPNQTTYTSGTSVTVTATAASGYVFTGWSGGASGTVNPLTVAMDGNKSVTANFSQVYTLTTNASPSGGGTVSRSPNQTTYTAGSSVIVTATAASGYVFTGWSGGASGTVNPLTVTMDGNKSVTAVFGAPPNKCGTDRTAGSCKTVTIGGKTWMAENLNIETENSWCYDNSPDSCAKYGRLYTWDAARTACPSGWHLPSREEWGALAVAAGGTGTYGTDGTAGKALKSTTGWRDNGNGTDTYGFSALPGGYRDSVGWFYNVGNVGGNGYWWTATEYSGEYAYIRNMRYNKDDVYEYYYYKSYGYAVRCLAD